MCSQNEAAVHGHGLEPYRNQQREHFAARTILVWHRDRPPNESLRMIPVQAYRLVQSTPLPLDICGDPTPSKRDMVEYVALLRRIDFERIEQKLPGQRDHVIGISQHPDRRIRLDCLFAHVPARLPVDTFRTGWRTAHTTEHEGIRVRCFLSPKRTLGLACLSVGSLTEFRCTAKGCTIEYFTHSSTRCHCLRDRRASRAGQRKKRDRKPEVG